MSTLVCDNSAADVNMPGQCGAGQQVNFAKCPLAGAAGSCADYQAVIARCLGRVRRWQVPPNWSKPQWMEEAQAQAQAEVAAAMAHGGAVEISAFWPQLTSRILNSVLKRYRQEWSFAGHCGYSMGFDPPIPEGKASECAPAGCPLEEALAQLPEADRALLESLYWHQRTESQVAVDWGISQQAISKRKRRIFKRLAKILQD
jgi:hypothetical protein